METPVLGSRPPDGLESKLTCVALTLSHVTHRVRGRLQSMRNWLYVINRKPANGPALAARVDPLRRHPAQLVDRLLSAVKARAEDDRVR